MSKSLGSKLHFVLVRVHRRNHLKSVRPFRQAVTAGNPVLNFLNYILPFTYVETTFISRVSTYREWQHEKAKSKLKKKKLLQTSASAKPVSIMTVSFTIYFTLNKEQTVSLPLNSIVERKKFLKADALSEKNNHIYYSVERGTERR